MEPITDAEWRQWRDEMGNAVRTATAAAAKATALRMVAAGVLHADAPAELAARVGELADTLAAIAVEPWRP